MPLNDETLDLPAVRDAHSKASLPRRRFSEPVRGGLPAIRI